MPLSKLRGVVGDSVRGVTHTSAELPNQDAIDWFPESGRGRHLVVALSDGHGSARCFRSDMGSFLGVYVAVALGREFLDEITRRPPDDAVERARSQLTVDLVARWADAVREDMGEHPLTDDELALVESRDGGGARRAVESNPLLAYGATLLLSILSDDTAVFLQLGDGDILAAYGDGSVARPLPDDPRLVGDMTTSLCNADAWKEFRVGHLSLGPESPRALVMATDGFGNAYPDERSLLRAGSAMMKEIREASLEGVRGRLRGWLEEASLHSGDDVTAAVLWLGDEDAAHAGVLGAAR